MELLVGKRPGAQRDVEWIKFFFFYWFLFLYRAGRSIPEIFREKSGIIGDEKWKEFKKNVWQRRKKKKKETF